MARQANLERQKRIVLLLFVFAALAAAAVWMSLPKPPPQAPSSDRPGVRADPSVRATPRLGARAIGAAPGAVALAEEETAQPPGDATIVGIVVDGRTGAPIPGVEVELSMGGGPLDVKTADRAGRFTFSSLDGGFYELQVETDKAAGASGVSLSPGLTEAVRIELFTRTRLLVQVKGEDGRPVAGAAVQVRVSQQRYPDPEVVDGTTDAKGELLARMRSGDAEVTARKDGYVEKTVMVGLEDGADARVVIDLRRGHPLLVRVLDPNGAPLHGADVRLFGADQERGELAAMTSTSGFASFPSVAAATYAAEVYVPGWVPVERNIAVEDRGGGQSVDLVATRGLSIRGRVVDGEGRPVATRMIEAHALSPSDGAGSRPSDVHVYAASAEDGRFALHGLAGGRWTIQTHDAVREVELKGEDAEIEIVALHAATESIAGRVRGRPSGFRACVVSGMPEGWPGGRDPSGDIAWAEIREDGSFQVQSLQKGEYRLAAFCQEGDTGSSWHEALAAALRTSGVLARTGDENVELSLGQGAEVIGRVELQGAPAEEAPGASGEIVAIAQGRKQTVTGGTFRIGGLAFGPTRVEVRAAGFAPAVKDLLLRAEESAKVELTLVPLESIEGRIVDARTSEPIDGASISASPMFDSIETSGMRTALTGANGAFVIRGLERGSYELEVTHTTHVMVMKDGVGSTGAGGAPIEVRMVPSGGLAGRLVRGGVPVPGATLVLMRAGTGSEVEQSEAQSPIAGSDANGRFSMRQVAPGRYRLAATIMSGRYGQTTDAYEMEVNVEEGQRAEVAFDVDDPVLKARTASVAMIFE